MCVSLASCICPAWLIQHLWKAKDHRRCLKQFTAPSQVQLLDSAAKAPPVTCVLTHTRNCQCVSVLLQISLAQSLPSHHSLFCSTPLLLYPSTLNSTTHTFYRLSSITCHSLLHFLAPLSSSCLLSSWDVHHTSSQHGELDHLSDLLNQHGLCRTNLSCRVYKSTCSLHRQFVLHRNDGRCLQ